MAAGAGPGMRHEHEQARRLERGQATLLAPGLCVAGDDVSVEGGDALPAIVGPIVVAVGTRVAAVPVACIMTTEM